MHETKQTTGNEHYIYMNTSQSECLTSHPLVILTLAYASSALGA